VSACVGFLRGLVDSGCFGFVFCVGAPGTEVCVSACFFLLGVGLRRDVARRFINWISALHTQPAEKVERFNRCKTHVARRFKNAVVYTALKLKGKLSQHTDY
jgi:hypothetical protein